MQSLRRQIRTLTHLLGVASERADVVLHPLERQKLILQAEVECAARGGLVALWETKGSDAVVETDKDDRRSLIAVTDESPHVSEDEMELTRETLCTMIAVAFAVAEPPSTKPPPYIHTITGRAASSLVADGRKTFTVRQSSEEPVNYRCLEVSDGS